MCDGEGCVGKRVWGLRMIGGFREGRVRLLCDGRQRGKILVKKSAELIRPGRKTKRKNC